MSGYTPLFSSIVLSTIWQESKDTKILFVTMLAIKDARGMVEASVPGLAKIAGLTIAEAETSLLVLSSEDAYSKTPDDDGRRIEKVDGGWRVINHEKYRNKCRERAEYMADYRRNKGKSSKKPKEGTEGKDERANFLTYIIPEKLSARPDILKAWGDWVKYRMGLTGKVKDWTLLFQKQLDWLATYSPEIALEIVNQSLRNGWRGLFELKIATNGKGQPIAPARVTDPDIREYALQAIPMIKNGQSMATFWNSVYDKFGKEKKQKISREVNMLLNNPEVLAKAIEEKVS